MAVNEVKLKVEKIEELKRARGWSNANLARKMGLDYAHCWKVVNGQTGVGLRFFTAFLKLCEKEGMDIREYVEY